MAEPSQLKNIQAYTYEVKKSVVIQKMLLQITLLTENCNAVSVVSISSVLLVAGLNIGVSRTIPIIPKNVSSVNR